MLALYGSFFVGGVSGLGWDEESGPTPCLWQCLAVSLSLLVEAAMQVNVPFGCARSRGYVRVAGEEWEGIKVR